MDDSGANCAAATSAALSLAAASCSTMPEGPEPATAAAKRDSASNAEESAAVPGADAYGPDASIGNTASDSPSKAEGSAALVMVRSG